MSRVMRSNEESSEEFLSVEGCKRLFDRVYALCSREGTTAISVVSSSVKSAKWIRSRMHVSSNVLTTMLHITRERRGGWVTARTTRLDDAGLREVVHAAETALGYAYISYNPVPDPPVPPDPILEPTLWDNPTFGLSAIGRNELAREMLEPAVSAGLIAAGDLVIGAHGQARIDSEGMVRYYPTTSVECSMTVRNPKAFASGWAGVNDYTLGRVDTKAISARAIEKCKMAENPVAIEPGRYIAILEPQAVSDLFSLLIDSQMDRARAEDGNGPFASGNQLSKIGEQVIDPRLEFVADPMDPENGFLPFNVHSGGAYRPVTWMEKGVLKDLSYDRRYAVSALGHEHALLNSMSYILRAAPGVKTTPLEQMIANTERGILVTRLSDVSIISSRTMLSAGYTRDGVWLIENGKISKPVRNFRFTESSLFALNSLLDVSEPQRVFRPGRATRVPAVRVRDFNFSSLADAV